ncbi:MAG: TIR domain-containing protein, partial [Saprospiraceae bacterium]
MIKEEKHNTRLERGREMVEDFILRSGDGNDKKHYRSLARYAALPLVLTVDLLTFLRQEFLRDIPWIVEVDLLLSDLCLEAGEDIYIMNQDARTYLISELRSEDDGLKNIERVNLSLLDHLDFLSKNHRSLKSREWETQKLSAMLCIFEKREEAVRTISRHLETLLNRPNQGSSDQSDENKKVKSELRWLSSFVSEMAENLEQYPGLVEAAVLIGQIMSARTPEEVDSIRNEVDSDRELADLPGISKPIRIDAIFRQILSQELSLLPNRPVTKIGPPDIFDDPQLRELIERTIISGNGNLDREEKMRAESMVRDLKSTRDSYKSAETLIQLGGVFQKVKNYADALHFYEYAQHTAAEPLQRAHIFRHIGDAKRQLQDSEGARRSYQSAVKLAHEAEEPLLEAEVLRTLVELEIEAGNHDWVIEHARRAIEILRKHRSPDLAFFQSLLFQSQNRDQFPDVFIIEAHQDSRFVETAVAQMMKSGLNVWRNQKIAPGSDLEFERKRKLYRSSHVLFFCSADSISSKYCRKEFDLAKRLQKPIIPVTIRHSLIPEWLAEYQSIDLTELGKNRDDHQISKLCKSIL